MSKLSNRTCLAANVQVGAMIACVVAGFYPEYLYAFWPITFLALMAAGWLYHFEKVERIEVPIEVPVHSIVSLPSSPVDLICKPSPVPLNPRVRDDLGKLSLAISETEQDMWFAN